MIELPNIPRLYTALAEVLAVCLYADRLPLRCGKTPPQGRSPWSG